MLKKVIFEILKIRGIDKPYRIFGEKYCNFLTFLNGKNIHNKHLSVIKRYAEILDIPVYFIVRIIKLELIDE